MDRKTLVTIVMSSLLTASAGLAIQAVAADGDRDVPEAEDPVEAAPQKVVCEKVAVRNAQEALQAAVSSGRADIRVVPLAVPGRGGGGSAVLICGW